MHTALVKRHTSNISSVWCAVQFVATCHNEVPSGCCTSNSPPRHCCSTTSLSHQPCIIIRFGYPLASQHATPASGGLDHERGLHCSMNLKTDNCFRIICGTSSSADAHVRTQTRRERERGLRYTRKCSRSAIKCRPAQMLSPQSPSSMLGLCRKTQIPI